jgi:hypothetical protein
LDCYVGEANGKTDAGIKIRSVLQMEMLMRFGGVSTVPASCQLLSSNHPFTGLDQHAVLLQMGHKTVLVLCMLYYHIVACNVV